jgi:signal transduction histidine kinase
MDAQETRIYTSVIITAIVLGTIITYFIISILRQQKKNMELHKQNILAEITQIEKERARIAADLHDDLGPLLSAVKMKINSFELSQKNQEEIIKTNQHIDDILKRIREISFDLMPNSLLRKGLFMAIKEFIGYLNNNSGFNFIFNGDPNIKLSEQRSINIYRIIQEIVHNAIKHSRATELKIELDTIKNNLVLRVADNGIGFDYNRESKNTIGFGLRSLLSRTEIMGGQMFLESEKGKGTTYTFEIPI